MYSQLIISGIWKADYTFPLKTYTVVKYFKQFLGFLSEFLLLHYHETK
jgi:hypothetical protein